MLRVGDGDIVVIAGAFDLGLAKIMAPAANEGREHTCIVHAKIVQERLLFCRDL